MKMSQLRPELSAVDYSPVERGAAAQGQAMQNIGQSIGAGIMAIGKQAGIRDAEEKKFKSQESLVKAIASIDPQTPEQERMVQTAMGVMELKGDLGEDQWRSMISSGSMAPLIYNSASSPETMQASELASSESISAKTISAARDRQETGIAASIAAQNAGFGHAETMQDKQFKYGGEAAQQGYAHAMDMQEAKIAAAVSLQDDQQAASQMLAETNNTAAYNRGIDAATLRFNAAATADAKELWRKENQPTPQEVGAATSTMKNAGWTNDQGYWMTPQNKRATVDEVGEAFGKDFAFMHAFRAANAQPRKGEPTRNGVDYRTFNYFN